MKARTLGAIAQWPRKGDALASVMMTCGGSCTAAIGSGTLLA